MAAGDRRVWAFFNDDPFWTIVHKGQTPDRAVARSLKTKLGADVTLWPQDSNGSTFRAQWFDPKTETFREARVEIWRL